MNNEINLILTKLKLVSESEESCAYICDKEHSKILYDYITNLQEKSNNQSEEINRLYKQREKFMKKYGYLKKENERLKELCDKYEEEHGTAFEEWKKVFNLRGKNLLLQKEKEDYKSRNEKIIRKISLYRMDDITMESNRILNDLLNVALGEDKDVKNKR